MHPYRETADLLRAMARARKRAEGKWHDPATVAPLHAEARELERLARLDEHATHGGSHANRR